MTDISKPTPKAQAENMLKKLFKGQEVHEIFSKSMDQQLTISGQPIDYWNGTFKIKIPTDNLTPAICQELDMEIMKLHEEATFHYAVATAKQQFLKRGAEAEFNSKFWAIYQEYKTKGGRLPGQDTLKTMASIGNEEVDSAQTIADIEVRFWKSILEHLSTCEKLVKNASMNISTELKYLK